MDGTVEFFVQLLTKEVQIDKPEKVLEYARPPTTAAAPSLEQRLDRLKGPQVQVDEAGLEGRLARLKGEPAPGGGAMSAADAQRHE